ncbi:AAA family ATPase [Runella salmonicolor]|uniref:AAA family ATPase n=1 Tax=Runella salmonicolor TaxID=2950278 RepID=A0ABT1FL24_9BACT|nr:ATP-binding protein [Runella salmonicolor]MCP1382461.1 AAA family ATPase [Runella salmonicolor]
MVQQITIENFKSIQSLTLELGRVNVFIGENGSGKSNILEAIAMGSAAAENKLDNEFLSSRGIRVTEPKAMRSGFEKDELVKDIAMRAVIDNFSTDLILKHDNFQYSKWRVVLNGFDLNKGIENIEKVKNIKQALAKHSEVINYDKIAASLELLVNQINLTNNVFNGEIEKFQNFLIYAPENYFLRLFEDEKQIDPLGVKGEGLFKLLSNLNEEKPEQFQKIRENLELIDWFEGFEIPNDLRFTERRIRIKDRFLEEGLAYFDQRSSNEGFLYLLFYFSLFISDYTPKFFAIDNIDNAMNPKLASRLVQQLTQLAKEHDKQVIMTTHNPAVLDGLDLKDDEQRLFVISRNKLGHTKALRITHKPTPEGQEPVRLSEQFLRGYIGGLPKNF